VLLCWKGGKFFKRFGYTLKEITHILGKYQSYWWFHQDEIKKFLVDKGYKTC
jgi:hypothetical protein